MKKKTINIILVFVITAAAAALYYNLARFVVRVNGDDVAFVEATSRMSLFAYVTDIFQRYSGRVSAKILEYLSGCSAVGLWQALEVICLTATGIVIYLFFKLFSDEKTQNVPVFGACMVLPLLPHLMTFNESFLWMAGTTNYSFIVVPGLYAAYLMCKHLKKGDSKVWEKALIILLLVWSSCGSEQASAVIMCLLFFLNLWNIMKKKIDVFAFVVFLIAAACFLACFVFSPGSKGRFDFELSQTPDFYTIPFLRHANFALRWFVNAVVNRMGFLFSFTLLLEGIAILTKDKRSRFQIFIAAGCLLFGVFSFFSNFFPGITDFMIGWGRGDYTKVSYVILGTWCFSLLFMLFGAAVSHEKYGKAATLLILAAYASLFVITLTPSMYPSGYRTGHVSAMIFSILIMLYSSVLISRSKRKMIPIAVITAVILICSGIHYFKLLKLFSSGYEAFYGGFLS